MKKTVLVVGKELPNAHNFVIGIKNTNRNIIIPDGTKIVWNKASPISARTFVLQGSVESENQMDAILCFDEVFLNTKFSKSDIQTASQINEEFILSFQYILIELKQFFKLHGGKIAFIYKELSKNVTPTCPFIKSAGKAFEALAESFSTDFLSIENVSPMMVKMDSSIEEFQNETTLAEWICSYFDALEQQKNQISSKRTISWIKPGSKPSGGFPLFH